MPARRSATHRLPAPIWTGLILAILFLAILSNGRTSQGSGTAFATLIPTATEAATPAPTGTSLPTATPTPPATSTPMPPTAMPLPTEDLEASLPELWREADPTERPLLRETLAAAAPTPTALPPVPTVLPPPTAAPGRPASHTLTGRPIVYLTFDDGLVRPTSLDLVETLARYEAQATFFVLGDLIEKDPELALEVSQAGHAIQNHTYNHVALDGLEEAQFQDEVVGAAQVIEAATGIAPRCVRPPWGAADDLTRQRIAELGLVMVKWDVDPQDWRRPGAAVIADHVIEHVYPGAIVILHDGPGDRSQTIEALETILEALGGAGYVFRALWGW